MDRSPDAQVRPQPFIQRSGEFTPSTWGEAMSAADESYTHQAVAPALIRGGMAPNWAERSYLSVRLGEGLMFDAGRAIYPYEGLTKGFLSVSTREAQHAIRAIEPFGPGDDPDHPQVGDVRIEVLEPLRRLRLRNVGADSRFGVDLIFEARTPIVPSERNVIELRGEVVTDYMNFYQSGYYSGTIELGGERYEIDRVAGFRDRGWGIRKHEGGPRRGFVLFAALELAETTVWLLLYEAASGERKFTNGWIVGADGVRDVVVAIEHDLDVAGADVHGGRLELRCESGARRRLDFEVDSRIFLAAGGYTPDPDWPPTGHSVYDLTHPEVVERLDGQNDNGCTCTLDGESGHGFVETGIGVHPRYRPAG